MVNAEVVYSNPGRGVGVQFQGLTENDRALMERELPLYRRSRDGFHAAARAASLARASPQHTGAPESKAGGALRRERDEDAFNALACDKQRALLILARRFSELGLWDAVRRIENVYGEGGVGMNFDAWPMLYSTLKRRTNFTSRFANHGDTTGGFIERGVGRASLHILFVDKRQTPLGRALRSL